MGFSVRNDKGFHITFDNGVTASVFFGFGSYTDNYDNVKRTELGVRSEEAEIAALNPEGEFISYNIDKDDFWCDDVAGHKSADEVMAFLTKCQNYDGPMRPIQREDEDI